MGLGCRFICHIAENKQTSFDADAWAQEKDYVNYQRLLNCLCERSCFFTESKLLVLSGHPYEAK
jgi:hypothetical protein